MDGGHVFHGNMSPCFYESEFVKRVAFEIVLNRSLLWVHHGQIRKTPVCVESFSQTRSDPIRPDFRNPLVAASRSVEEFSSHKLLSVPIQDRTPNNFFARGDKEAFQERTHLYFGSHSGDPHEGAVRSTPIQKKDLKEE